MQELKPCPFCGYDVKLNYDPEMAINGIYCWHCHMMVMYTNIDVRPKQTMGEAAKEYAERWNGRVNE